MYDRVLQQLWMLLPREQRRHLVTVFDIPHSGVSEIKDQTVISDGHTQEDLMAITAEKMELYVGSKETFPRLWELTVAKCHYELNPPIGIIQGPGVEPFKSVEQELANHDEIIEASKPAKHAKKAKGK